MSFTLRSGRIFCDLHIRADNPPSAQKGIGNYLFGVELHMEVKPAESVERILMEMSGTLNFRGRPIAALTTVRPLAIRSNPTHGYPTTASLRALLARDSLAQIEDLRNGGDVDLELALSAIVNGIEKRPSTNEPVLSSEVVSHALSFRIAQTEWLKLLESWEFGEKFVIEIPVQGTSAQSTTAPGYLKIAQKMFLQGNWAQSVAECRKVLEAIHHSLDRSASIKSLLETRSENSLPKRVLLSVLVTKEVCHPASHGDSNAASINWTRSDAELVLVKTAACLKHFDSVIQ